MRRSRSRRWRPCAHAGAAARPTITHAVRTAKHTRRHMEPPPWLLPSFGRTLGRFLALLHGKDRPVRAARRQQAGPWIVACPPRLVAANELVSVRGLPDEGGVRER